MPAIRQLPGMRDETPRELGHRTSLQEILHENLSSHGYKAIDTPLIESTELFLRKSGVELSTSMYTFTDPGGSRVSLRPEFTSSVIRYYLERVSEETLPMRIQYSGPVFRYDHASGLKQFHQAGAEIIGTASTESDGEILALAQDGLFLMGSPVSSFVVGHVGVLHLILDEIGISHRGQDFLIASLTSLKQNPDESQKIQERAYALGFMKSEETAFPSNTLLDDMEEEEALSLLQDIFHSSLSGIQGSRSMKDILTRFIQKLKRGDDSKKIEHGISLFSRLASIKGEEEQALSQIRTTLKDYGISQSVIIPLEDVLASFHKRCPSTPLVIDIGLVRGIAYYTGMVFEILGTGPNGPITLCGGGRYDGLVKAIGRGPDVPAIGFAYTMESILSLSPENLT
jgi:histidyl-tRNA synthetase